MEGSIRTPSAGKAPVILETNPDPRGFLSRYLLALTPLFLLLLSLVTTAVIRGFTAGIPASIPTPMGNLFPGMGDMVEMLVLLTAPIGIFSLFVLIGVAMKFTEMWTASALALGLSGLGGLLLVTLSPDPSLNRIMDFLYWIAYLIGPASGAAVVLVLAWAEKFRRSIRYTITGEGVITRGGIWRQQEHLLPLHQIGKLVLEHGMVGRLLDTGTIIPIGMAQRGPGPAGARQELSRNPLDCLYGVREPEKVMALLNRLISPPAGQRDASLPSGKIPRTR
jgi:hypothetical protein